MELKGSKTEKNLNDAFAGESMARNKYTFFAEKAREEGYEQIANIFLEKLKKTNIWMKMHEIDEYASLLPDRLHNKIKGSLTL